MTEREKEREKDRGETETEREGKGETVIMANGRASERKTESKGS